MREVATDMKILEGKRNEMNSYKAYPRELFHLAFLWRDDVCVFVLRTH